MTEPEPESTPRPTVTLTQHRIMAQHKVAYRKSDGKWGFKRRCANPACQRIVSACYCSNTLEEALVEVKTRSAYTCSTRCALKVSHSYLSDSFQGWKPGEVAAFADDERFTSKDYEAVEAALRSGKPDSVRGMRRKVLYAWAEEEMSNWEGDGDDGECSCEI